MVFLTLQVCQFRRPSVGRGVCRSAMFRLPWRAAMLRPPRAAIRDLRLARGKPYIVRGLFGPRED